MKPTDYTPRQFCEKFDACSTGAKFALKFETMSEVWDNCQSVDWLCWILERLKIEPDERKVREYMCWVALNTPLHDGRTVEALLTEKASRNAIKVALRFARDEANEEELSTARSTARSGARSAAWSAAESAQAGEFKKQFPNPFKQ